MLDAIPNPARYDNDGGMSRTASTQRDPIASLLTRDSRNLGFDGSDNSVDRTQQIRQARTADTTFSAQITSHSTQRTFHRSPIVRAQSDGKKAKNNYEVVAREPLNGGVKRRIFS